MKKYQYGILAAAAVFAAAPLTAFAAGNEVSIDYKDAAADDIVITEASDGMFEEGRMLVFAVEKIEVSGDVTCHVEKGDIEISAELTDKDGLLEIFKDSENVSEMKKTLSDSCSYLVITVEDESTEASRIVISGLRLYLDRTLPVGGYALKNVYTGTGIWENTSTEKDEYEKNGVFKYEPLVVDPDYVQVVTAPRDQDDSTLNRKVSVGVGSEQITAGMDIIDLDAPAYINDDGYAMLPARAIAEALGATVNWDEESRSVSVFSGKRIVSMKIGDKTMYINGTPIPMNAAPEISNGRTFLPVRDLANALGIKNIDWSEETSTITLN